MSSAGPTAQAQALETSTFEIDQRFRTMADHAPVLLWMAGIDGLCEFFNDRWLKFTGRSMQEEVGNGWAEGVHPEDFQSCMNTYLAAFVERREFSMEYRLRRSDGEYRWVYDQGTPRFEAGGLFAGYIGSCVDVTEQRRAQQTLLLNAELTASLREQAAIARERDVLLREVHHRVKNDLQLVSSILEMQGRLLSEPASKDALEDCENRVRTLALLHEQLYRSIKPSHVSLPLAVRNLALATFRVADPGYGAIQLKLDVEGDQLLSVERAIPCVLILNELVTNALKHAFPAGRRGTVCVTLRAENQNIMLSIADDGIGMPTEEVLAPERSLGWRLVLALAEQLSAQIHVERSGGTTVSVRFSLSGEDDPALRNAATGAETHGSL